MSIDRRAVLARLKAFDFPALFTQNLGWDRFTSSLGVEVGDDSYTLQGVAEKRGVQIFEVRAAAGEAIPDYNARRKIEKQVTKAAYEHLIVFTDAEQTTQIWQWVARAPGSPDACREVSYRPATQSGDLLFQKLQTIRFTLDEEESIDIACASHRLRDAFDRDRVTKKFFKRFSEEQQAFLGFIDGIADQTDRKWYASLMLNRLMFVWFIQQKGFLDGHGAYLQDRLDQVRRVGAEGRFHTFYRYFLLALFHEGFGKREQDRELDEKLTALLGRIPYLNGGLFDPHEIERGNDSIHIPDEAFERLFAFFGDYDWHLDTRTISQGNEINPDVLGYIFEKYINQKQMGAYYTKEDITEYISKNTILPFLFDAAGKRCKVAFQPGSAMWRMLQDDPDAFIYPVMRKGVVDAGGDVIPLPAEIEEGVDTTLPNLLERRRGWNARASEEYALPTEIWREHVARRQRCLEIRKKLRAGEIREVNDLITYNLDIRQFAERVISECEAPELLRAFWKSIRAVTVLDPTCGSGAFLFAALEILYPLYEACLTRMQGFVEDLDRSGQKHSPRKFSDFRDVLADIDRHPSRDYFILKSIIVHNLYGVDIMPEAVEICKLRLFLKLVAQVDRAEQLEPLPDVDFNIRAGNTLVGFATEKEVRQHMTEFQGGQMRLLDDDELASYQRFATRVEELSRLFDRFREQQTTFGGEVTATDKQALRTRLRELDEELNGYLAREYGVDVGKKREYRKWLKSHQPFHWFVEFYGIMAAGGFDVIVGNPPYVVYSEARVGYALKDELYRTVGTKNLYAYAFERSLQLANKNAPVGLIVQLTAMSAEKMASLQDLLSERGMCFAPAFPRRPESMFDGVEMPVSILLSYSTCGTFVTTRINRFYTSERPHALQTLAFCEHPLRPHGHRVAKLGEALALSLLEKVIAQKGRLDACVSPGGEFLLYYQEACRYWTKACLGYPHFKRNGKKGAPPHGRGLPVVDSEAVSFGACLLNSSLFYWYYSALSDCEHINDALVRSFPVPSCAFHDSWLQMWKNLDSSLAGNGTLKTIRTKQGHTIEYVEMDAALSKAVIDEIDAALANHYGFTDEELDFIINYDIKYRMGDALADISRGDVGESQDKRQRVQLVTLKDGCEGPFYAFSYGYAGDDRAASLTLEATPEHGIRRMASEGALQYRELADIQSYVVDAHMPRREFKKMFGGRPPEEGRWYRMSLVENEPMMATFFDSESEETVGAGVSARLTELPKEELDAVQARIHLPSEDDSHDRFVRLKTRLMRRGKNRCVVAIYDVGQGLCSALCNAADGVPLLYFDFGCGTYANAETRPEDVRFHFARKPPIVLSHWHSDHFMGARMLDRRALDMEWLAPSQIVGPAVARFAAKLHLKGKLAIWPTSMESLKTPNFSVLRCGGNDLNSDGLAMTVACYGLAVSKESPARVLLPGDAGYDHIPQVDTRYHGIAVTHHGGHFLGTVPSAFGREAPCVVSYGDGNSHGHPFDEDIQAHTDAGWVRRFNTKDGHVELGLRVQSAGPTLESAGSRGGTPIPVQTVHAEVVGG